MIELLRYARVKPEGLVRAENCKKQPFVGDFQGVTVYFKRFDVENGKEVDPEVSVIPYEDLSRRLEEMKVEMEVLKELLALKPEEGNG